MKGRRLMACMCPARSAWRRQLHRCFSRHNSAGMVVCACITSAHNMPYCAVMIAHALSVLALLRCSACSSATG